MSPIFVCTYYCIEQVVRSDRNVYEVLSDHGARGGGRTVQKADIRGQDARVGGEKHFRSNRVGRQTLGER